MASTRERRAVGWALTLSVVLVSALAGVAVAAPAASATPGAPTWAPRNGCEALLNARPFAPSGPTTVFSDGTFPNGIGRPVASTPRNLVQELADLTRVLATRAGRLHRPDLALHAATAFADLADPALVARVPAVNLRAGLLMLRGTTLEPALTDLTSGRGFDRIIFGPVQPGAVAESLPVAREIHVNPALVNERGALFTGTLGHEDLHQDTAVAQYEEETALTLGNVVFLEQLRDLPDLPTPATLLTQINDEQALGLLNSGPEFRLGLLSSHGRLFPGGTSTARTFDEYARSLYSDSPRTPTPGNPTLTAALALAATPGTHAPAASAYDQTTVNYLDRNLDPARLDACDLAADASALHVVPDRGAHPESTTTPRAHTLGGMTGRA